MNSTIETFLDIEAHVDSSDEEEDHGDDAKDFFDDFFDDSAGPSSIPVLTQTQGQQLVSHSRTEQLFSRVYQTYENHDNLGEVGGSGSRSRSRIGQGNSDDAGRCGDFVQGSLRAHSVLSPPDSQHYAEEPNLTDEDTQEMIDDFLLEHPIVPVLWPVIARNPPDARGEFTSQTVSSQKRSKLTRQPLIRRESVTLPKNPNPTDLSRLQEPPKTFASLPIRVPKQPDKRLSTFPLHSRGQGKAKKLKDWASWVQGTVEDAPEDGTLRRELAPGEWVVVCTGPYRGDVAQIYRTKTVVSSKLATSANLGDPQPKQEIEHFGYLVIIVPRLPPPYYARSSMSKRKRRGHRFDARLFDPKEYGLRVTKEEFKGFIFEDHWLTYGLLIKFFRVTSLAPANYVSFHSQHHAPVYMKHPFCRNFPFPTPESFRFEPGDEVIVKLEHQSKPFSGTVVAVHDGAVHVDLKEEFEEKVVRAQGTSLQKVIIPGNRIVVLSGIYEGKEGLVVERHGALLALSFKNSSRGIVSLQLLCMLLSGH
ncbi:hypothetical protein V5O48_018249 [Marasmius crinis-equi]|uniref:KOW domain-containing protein n=1 Tax=Marasmius crinis-equi TaxID=585013 RepID=A0ABR3ELP8_9AGAR